MTIQKALDDIEHLSFEEQSILIDILKKRYIEKRRDEILKNGKETLEAIRSGRAKSGTVEDLKKDLLSEE